MQVISSKSQPHMHARCTLTVTAQPFSAGGIH